MISNLIYIADLDQDIDDCIAAEYLQSKGILTGIVCDPTPKEKAGIYRFKQLKRKGIHFYQSIPNHTSIVIVGGALTKTAQYLKKNQLEYLFIQGGYAGPNVTDPTEVLKKFQNKNFMRTYNFNLDVNATNEVLTSNKINQIFLIGKNVCHSFKNTPEYIWKTDPIYQIMQTYQISPTKRMHDLLACHEALSILTKQKILNTNDKPYLTYKTLYPITEIGLQNIYTKWGSSKSKTEYHPCQIAIGWNNHS